MIEQSRLTDCRNGSGVAQGRREIHVLFIGQVE